MANPPLPVQQPYYPPYGYPPMPYGYGQPAEVPEARGKAAAFDTWLARGGATFRYSGRFKKSGPLKGKTYDEAKAMFERMWAKAPDSVKNKYASRSTGATTDLAPIERPGANAPALSPAEQQKKRMAQYGHEFDANGNAVPINRKRTQAESAPGTSNIAQGPPAPVANPATPGASAETPAQHAANKGEGPSFEELTTPNPVQPVGTDFNGDGSVTPADAEAAAAAPVDANNQPVEMPDLKNGTPEEWKAYNEAMAAKNPPQSMGDTPIGKAAAAIIPPTSPLESRQGRGARKLPVPSPDPVVATPVQEPPVAPPAGTSTAAQVAAPAQAPPFVGPPNPFLPTDERMHAEGKTNAGGVPINKAPPAPTQTAAQINSAPVAKPQRINSLTGLPFGYRPGDQVDPQFKQVADASVLAQQNASPANLAPVEAPRPLMPRGPASQPAQVGPVARPDGYQARSVIEDIRRQQAADQARNAGTMGDYFTAQGQPDMAAAFPNKTTDAGADAQLAARDPEGGYPKARPVTNYPVEPPAPVSTRVVAQRPATAMESRTGVPNPQRNPVGISPIKRPRFALAR